MAKECGLVARSKRTCQATVYCQVLCQNIAQNSDDKQLALMNKEDDDHQDLILLDWGASY